MKMHKRVFVRIMSFCIALMLVASGLAISEYNKRVMLVSQIRNGYNENLTEFISYLTEINADLQKQLFTGTPESLSELSANVYKNTAAAKECLASLPISVDKSASIFKFLSQAGDFSLAVSKNTAKNKSAISGKEQEQLESLLSYSTSVTEKFTTLTGEITEGDSFDGDIDNVINSLNNDTDFSTGIEDIEQTATNYPKLIYDGPFSDHVAATEPKCLKNENTVTKKEALEIAKKYLDQKEVQYKSTENSNTESFVFEGDNSICAITKKGGYCLYLNKSYDIKENNIYEDYAINTAVGYLKDMTGLTFEPSYYMIDENIMTVNLAYKQNDVVCYPDLIKVGISMDDAKIVSVEARGFLMNHHKRNIEAPKNTVEKAEKVINANLTVKSCKKCITIDDSLNEHYCYEFQCKSKDKQDVLVYITTDTLEEEQLFILLHTEGGTLTR